MSKGWSPGVRSPAKISGSPNRRIIKPKATELFQLDEFEGVVALNEEEKNRFTNFRARYQYQKEIEALVEEFHERRGEISEQITAELRNGRKDKADQLIEVAKGLPLDFKVRKEEIFLRIQDELAEKRKCQMIQKK